MQLLPLGWALCLFGSWGTPEHVPFSRHKSRLVKTCIRCVDFQGRAAPCASHGFVLAEHGLRNEIGSKSTCLPAEWRATRGGVVTGIRCGGSQEPSRSAARAPSIWGGAAAGWKEAAGLRPCPGRRVGAGAAFLVSGCYWWVDSQHEGSRCCLLWRDDGRRGPSSRRELQDPLPAGPEAVPADCHARGARVSESW